MKRRTIAPLLGVILCVLTLALSVVLQHSGYLAYLNGDMSSEVILAKRQVVTGSLVQMDWLYSTEIHTLHMNLLYALAFFVTPSFEWARIIGNTVGFALGMGALVYLCRVLRLSFGAALCTAALLPVAAGTLYASNMTIGGYYIVHLTLGFWLAGVWLSAGERGGWRLPAFAALCALEGFLSVRYVLCFVCPMLAAAVLDAIFARDEALAGRVRFALLTAVGFAACVAGYVASEIVVPRLFTSGTGAASSFQFNPLDGPTFLQTLAVVFADLLKLFGWRGAVGLFSGAGMVNLLVAAVLFFGVALLVRALRRAGSAGPISERACRLTCRGDRGRTSSERALDASGARRMLLLYACAAFLVNLFCFVFIQGTYLNRYLIVAMIFFVPALPVALAGEDNPRLRSIFLLLLAAWLALASAMMLVQTRADEAVARERGEGMRQAVEALEEMGYSHGYGTFWNVRVMEERSQGALTFTGVTPTKTEEAALVSCAPAFIRWLEPDGWASLDVCEGKTFLILTHAERRELADWLALTGAQIVYENADYAAYGFESSQAFVTDMLLGCATLEPGDAAVIGENGLETVTLGAGGRLRMPPGYREAGSFVLTFVCEGEPGQDGVVRAYAGYGFQVLAEQQLAQGENRFAFELNSADKYFMLQILAGEAGGLNLTDIRLERDRAQ